MKVRDGLTSGLSGIDAEVETVGRQARIDLRAHRIDRSEQRSPLFGRGVEPAGNVPTRDDERVPFGDWKAIP